MKRCPLYEKALKLLYKEYDDVFEIVKSSSYHRAFANEKIRHSMQVLGAGNGILKHEKYFLNKPSDFIETARVAILLHDVYRFKEILGWFESNTKIDHGEKGAEFLSQTDDFNNILITMPIKHHGHMIEKMYEDEAYQKLDDKTKDEVRHIAFAVRDADKIANWNLLKNEWENMKEVWLPYPNDHSKVQAEINKELWGWFMHFKVAPNNLRRSNADVAMSVICWLFDMNYHYSILYCQKLDLFKGMCEILRKFEVDEHKVKTVYQVMEDFVLKKFGIKI